MPDDPFQTIKVRRPRRRVRQLFVALLLILFGGPLLLSLTRSEVSNWSLAASYERELRGRLGDARSLLDVAIRWSPDRADLYARRAQTMLASGDAQAALPDCDRYVELVRKQSAGFDSTYGSAYLASALNQRAYTYALCQRDLDEALESIQEALDAFGSNESFLDTRGYIYLLMDRLEKAKADIEAAVALAEENYKADRNNCLEQIRSAIDKRPAEQRLERLGEMFAVLYHHRGELYQKLGRTEEAKADLARADRLGYDPAQGVW